jgi:ATP-dependent DNA helicase RecQ
VNEELFERLRSLRRKLAQQRAVPAYIVFNDATLRDLARQRPSSPEDLLRVSGIGMKKLEQYGEAILSEINKSS